MIVCYETKTRVDVRTKFGFAIILWGVGFIDMQLEEGFGIFSGNVVPSVLKGEAEGTFGGAGETCFEPVRGVVRAIGGARIGLRIRIVAVRGEILKPVCFTKGRI